jgi:membrane protein implicated in regulation of membrane protease activity
MSWVWLSFTVVFIVVELTTIELVSIWFAIAAAITSIIVAIFGNIPVVWQAIIFVALSAILLASTRPFMKKLLKKNKNQETNLELVLGKVAIVVEDIDNIQGKGAIKINGLVWSARNEDNGIIKKDELVVFKSIDGNKAIVKRKGE